MLNEIMAWVGSSSFGSDRILHSTRVEHLVHTSITILKAPGQRRRVYRGLAFCGLTVMPVLHLRGIFQTLLATDLPESVSKSSREVLTVDP